MSSKQESGIIILAAGQSSRMGRAKALLPIGKQSMIRHIVSIALESASRPIIVVLGNYRGMIRSEIEDLPVATVRNEDWEMGMGSSISTGIAALQQISPETTAAIVLVADQPLITAQHLDDLSDQLFQNQHQIIASAYADTLGVPAIFHRDTFATLSDLSAKGGAKQLISNSIEQGKGASISFPAGSIDLDTPEEYEDFLKKE